MNSIGDVKQARPDPVHKNMKPAQKFLFIYLFI